MVDIKGITDAVDRAMHQMEVPKLKAVPNIDDIPLQTAQPQTHPRVEEMINGLESTFAKTAERLEYLSKLFADKSKELQQRATDMRELSANLPGDIRQAVSYEQECFEEIRRLAHIK